MTSADAAPEARCSIHELRQELRARPMDGAVNLAGYDTSSTPFVDSKSEAKDDLDDHLRDDLFDWHERLFAESERSVLLVLQGPDCAGKNGTIKHVVTAMNPAGVRVASFSAPTEDEQAHQFLWRHRAELPGPGRLGVFNRSHYEDVIVPSAQGSEDESTIEERIAAINEFESSLVDQGTTIVKCFLHLSYDEQRERFLRRLRRDDKRWKFSEADLEHRRDWSSFQEAFGSVMARTSPDHAPWLVIPADRKWYRNWIVAQILIATFESLAPAYPQPDLDLEGLRARLEPPN